MAGSYHTAPGGSVEFFDVDEALGLMDRIAEAKDTHDQDLTWALHRELTDWLAGWLRSPKASGRCDCREDWDDDEGEADG